MQTQFPSVRIQNLLRNANDGRFDHRVLIDTVDRECCLAAANKESGYNMLQQLQVTAQVWEDSLTRKSSSTVTSSSLFRKTVHEILCRVQAGITVQRKLEEGQIQETQIQKEYRTQVAQRLKAANKFPRIFLVVLLSSMFAESSWKVFQPI